MLNGLLTKIFQNRQCTCNKVDVQHLHTLPNEYDSLCTGTPCCLQGAQIQ